MKRTRTPIEALNPLENEHDYYLLRQRYLQRIRETKNYLPDALRAQLTRSLKDVSTVGEYRKLKKEGSLKEINRDIDEMYKFMNKKISTKKGYKEVLDNRYGTWKGKINGLSRETFDDLMSDFNDLKTYLDSEQLAADYKLLVEEKSEEAALKFRDQLKDIIEKAQKEKSKKSKNEYKKIQKAYSKLRKKLRS